MLRASKPPLVEGSMESCNISSWCRSGSSVVAVEGVTVEGGVEVPVEEGQRDCIGRSVATGSGNVVDGSGSNGRGSSGNTQHNIHCIELSAYKVIIELN